mmetsp:Transcript_73722/g.173153  ORF Transcript_73722/g.173153 Transcript_73722/m.173153 type:complete len:236 (-) Transcript_73722:21-728(-)
MRLVRARSPCDTSCGTGGGGCASPHVNSASCSSVSPTPAASTVSPNSRGRRFLNDVDLALSLRGGDGHGSRGVSFGERGVCVGVDPGDSLSAIQPSSPSPSSSIIMSCPLVARKKARRAALASARSLVSATSPTDLAGGNTMDAEKLRGRTCVRRRRRHWYSCFSCTTSPSVTSACIDPADRRSFSLSVAADTVWPSVAHSRTNVAVCSSIAAASFIDAMMIPRTRLYVTRRHNI